MSSKLHHLASIRANQHDIVAEFARKTGITKEESKILVGFAAEAISEFIAQGCTVHHRELGTFLAGDPGGKVGVQFVPSNALLARCIEARPGWVEAHRLKREEAEAERARQNRMHDILEEARAATEPPQAEPR